MTFSSSVNIHGTPASCALSASALIRAASVITKTGNAVSAMIATLFYGCKVCAAMNSLYM